MAGIGGPPSMCVSVAVVFTNIGRVHCRILGTHYFFWKFKCQIILKDSGAKLSLHHKSFLQRRLQDSINRLDGKIFLQEASQTPWLRYILFFFSFSCCIGSLSISKACRPFSDFLTKLHINQTFIFLTDRDIKMSNSCTKALSENINPLLVLQSKYKPHYLESES